MLRQSASRFLLPAVRSAIQSRSQSAICGPPTKHVPKGELYSYIVAIVTIPFIYPIWISLHIKEYRDEGK